jgi:surface carbohydrate biosynthesis protein (TIGR04326 family)
MGRILITNSIFLLKRRLRKAKGAKNLNGCYLKLSDSSQEFDGFLQSHGFNLFKVNPPAREKQDAMLRDYLEAMGRMGEINGQDPQWWATNIASKNRFTSPLPQLLDALVRCTEAIEETAENNQMLVIVLPPWPVVKTLKRTAKKQAWDLEIISWPGSKLLARLRGRGKAWMNLLKEIVLSVGRILEVRRHFGRVSPKSAGNRPVYLIRSFVYANAFSENGSYKDPFFGQLSEFLSQSLGDATDILTVVFGSEKRTDCYRQMKALKDRTVVPLESFLNYRDVLKGFLVIVWGRIAKNFRIPDEVPFLDHDISGLLKETLSSGGWIIPFSHYLHHPAATCIARNHRILACLITYEGNPWERMFIEGLHKSCPDLFIIGYQHAVIPQSAAGMFLSNREVDQIPLPSSLLTTGPGAASILEKYGAFADGLVKAVCALRFGYLYDFRPMARRNSKTEFQVLVVLEGVRDVLPLVMYVLDQAPKSRDINFRIRAHPVLPFGKLLSYLENGTEMPENMEVSSGKSVVEDVGESDVILYWGTTVALEALMLGKPVIHFDRGDLLSYDPLFELGDFKWRVSDRVDLKHILSEIRELPDHEYSQLQETARRYVTDYFRPVDDNSLTKFLPKEVVRSDTKEQ